jgi:7-cyano-7-deazaguanine synthase
MKNKRKAVVLLSGGIDSTTTLYIAGKMGFDLYALSFYYGQRHKIELRAAGEIARHYGVIKHITLDIDLRLFGNSALTDDIAVPKSRNVTEIAGEIPVTYVPARNTIFLSFALAWAEVLESNDIFIGVNALDYSGYPDCRPEYIQAYENLANLATKAAVEGKQKLKIHTPLIELTKAQIIQQASELGVDFLLTHSCYDPAETGQACGECDSCLLRLKGFKEAGIPDPTIYKINDQ